MSSNALLVLKDISKKFGDTIVLKHISITIDQDKFIVIRGTNGSGKSTLLKIISGLIPLSSGNRAIISRNLTIGYTPDRLSPLKMSSTEYLTHMGRVSGIAKHLLAERISKLHQLFILEQSSLAMSQYSKGMLQKVNIMQALLHEPDLLVLDEPFSGLDKQSIQHLISSLTQVRVNGTTIIAAIHEPQLLSSFNITTYTIKEGRIEQEQDNSNVKDMTKVEGIGYELIAHYNLEANHLLANVSAHIRCQINDNKLIVCHFEQQDYAAVLQVLIQSNIELIRITRREL